MQLPTGRWCRYELDIRHGAFKQKQASRHVIIACDNDQCFEMIQSCPARGMCRVPQCVSGQSVKVNAAPERGCLAAKSVAHFLVRDALVHTGDQQPLAQFLMDQPDCLLDPIVITRQGHYSVCHWKAMLIRCPHDFVGKNHEANDE